LNYFRSDKFAALVSRRKRFMQPHRWWGLDMLQQLRILKLLLASVLLVSLLVQPSPKKSFA
jgi:hypothetical protein